MPRVVRPWDVSLTTCCSSFGSACHAHPQRRVAPRASAGVSAASEEVLKLIGWTVRNRSGPRILLGSPPGRRENGGPGLTPTMNEAFCAHRDER